MGALILSLVIGLGIGLILSIYHAIAVFRTIAYEKELSMRLREQAHVDIDWNRVDDSWHRPVANIIGFPILWSVVFFVVALIVISTIKWIK